MKKLVGFSLIWIVIDFIIKMLVAYNMEVYDAINLTNFLSITYVKNTGAAFSILDGNRIFLILIAFIAINIIYIYYQKEIKINKVKNVTYSLLLGGIIGNLIDRVLYGYVIDYISFKILNYNFPVFNFADICIVIGCILMIILIIKEERKCKNI